MIFLINLVTAHAQWQIGLRAGIDHNQMLTTTDALSYTQNTPAAGYAVGLHAEYALGKNLSLQTAPMYLRKDYSFERTGPYQGIYQHFHNVYLQLPLSLSFHTRYRRVEFSLIAGGYAAWLLNARVEGKIPDIFGITDTATFPLAGYNTQYSGKADRRLEVGLSFGAAAGYYLTPKSKLSIEGTWCRAVSDRQKHYMTAQPSHFNETWIFSTVYTYVLSFKHKRS